jgi:preprotein translocase subunit SecE
MAMKAMLVNGEEQQAPEKPEKLTPVKRQSPSAEPNVFENAVGTWKEFTQFLSDVRAEMRKVVTPSRREVETTTTVVLIAVFIFGLFFFICDWIFGLGLTNLLNKLGGL